LPKNAYPKKADVDEKILPIIEEIKMGLEQAHTLTAHRKAIGLMIQEGVNVRSMPEAKSAWSDVCFELSVTAAGVASAIDTKVMETEGEDLTEKDAKLNQCWVQDREAYLKDVVTAPVRSPKQKDVQELVLSAKLSAGRMIWRVDASTFFTCLKVYLDRGGTEE